MDLNESINFRSSKFRRELRNSIVRHFNLEELKILAHDLSVDWESIPGEMKRLKVQELIDYLDRRGSLGELTRELRQSRPQVDWPGFPQGTMIQISFEYEVSGKTQDNVSVFTSGKAHLNHEIEGEYFDEGLAFAEAVAASADHAYIFEVEKKGHIGISELHVSIYNLEASIDLPIGETE